MANPRVIIDIITQDKTQNGFSQILSKLGMSDEKIKQINEKLPAMAAKFTLITAAIGAVVDFTKKAVEETVRYGDSMNELSLATGQSAEDMSRLAGAAERFGVDYKTLMTGLGTASKNGIDTSIDSLLELADQYNAIQDPIKQAKLMTELFGAAGPEMAKIFRRGSDDIVLAMGDIRDAMVWDADKQAAIDDYQYALTELKQSFQALKISVGTEVIPVITGFLEILNGEGKATLGSTQTEVEMLANKYSGLAGTAGGANLVLETTATRLNDIAVGSLGAQTGLNGVGTTAEENAGKIWHFADGAWSLVAGLNSIPSHTDAYVKVHYSFEGLDSRDAAEFAKPTLGEWKPDWMGSSSLKFNTTGGGPGGANGLNFIVPPGYPNDSYPIRVQSGEHVKVTPKNQVQQGLGMEFDYDRNAEALVMAMMRSGLVR